ncbi:hypothetical protein [Deinococcus soli (ex Cha et al. 2016)]|uniref:hypothetical protein n=1 Tax=Deinococcus soli (ex Cha et al. 2016) TaxID=1309411 RepID=UPI0016654B00|nr:hypothetical protein [Deinococcus soli (ex Cha et al. 2016)]GGB71618.1 hypothetical protein GCM10008019_29700 [Deinococcus soli (ex Cha et al. 2016)]
MTNSTTNPNRHLDLHRTPAQVRRDARRDTTHDRVIAGLIADAKARGVTGLRCDACGCQHGLGRIGLDCNASTDDGGTCGHWNLSEIVATVKFPTRRAAHTEGGAA